MNVWDGPGIDFDDRTLQQVMSLARLPFVRGQVALMPDGRVGVGSTVGSVFATKGAIVPAAVGVDIGCGMMAVRLTLTASDLPDNLHHIRESIEQAVPHGRTDNGGPNDRGAWGELPSRVFAAWARLGPTMEWALATRPALLMPSTSSRAPRQLGTLGTGNHFIELCLDEEQWVWVMLHSGSRGIGNRIGTYFIELAKRAMERWFVHLPDGEAHMAYTFLDILAAQDEGVRRAQRRHDGDDS